MSKISPDPIKQLQDQYQARERKSENRQKEELNEIRESHKAELSKLREETEVRINKIQEESNSKLSQKDMQHQKDIEALRAFYRKKS